MSDADLAEQIGEVFRRERWMIVSVDRMIQLRLVRGEPTSLYRAAGKAIVEKLQEAGHVEQGQDTGATDVRP